MGGNVTIEIDGVLHSATTLDTSSIEKHSAIILNFHDFFGVLKNKIRALSWDIDRPFFSGSSALMFDHSYLLSYSSYKAATGDIDIQIDKRDADAIKAELAKLIGKKVGQFLLLGVKNSNEQVITLWKTAIGNVQIDFEFVTFENGKPTEFEKFAHGSSFDDLELGIKGVFSKFLLRAISALYLANGTLVRKRGLQPGPLPLKSFSVKGLRSKYKRAEHLDHVTAEMGRHKDAYIANETAEFVTEWSVVIKELLGTDDVPPRDIAAAKSFKGQVGLIKKYFDAAQKATIVAGFKDVLFGPRSQHLYRDHDRSNSEKQVALDYLLKNI